MENKLEFVSAKKPQRVLVADDDPVVRDLLQDFLEEWGYTPVIVEEGHAAWRTLRSPSGPSLAVLDWMMPGMDGLDILRSIRRSNLERYVYIIMLTGRQDEESIIKGFEAGADDFVRKPFDAREMNSRMKVGERMVILERRIRAYASQMEQLAKERAAQLVHADRLSSLGIMAAGVAHEINNPSMAISANFQIMEQIWEEIRPALVKMAQQTAYTHLPEDRLAMFLEEIPDLIQNGLNGVNRISRIVDSLKTYARKDGSGHRPCDLNACVQDALALCGGPLKSAIRLQFTPYPAPAMFTGEAQEIEQIFTNLIVNAADALENKRDAAVDIVITREDDHWIASLEDNGPGIPEQVLKDIWKPFFTTKELGKGTGLGLSIAQSIVEKHRGRLTAENRAEGGARFLLTLPTMH